MDFFEAQEAARRKSKWLYLWFILAILGVLLAVNGLVLGILGPDQWAVLVAPVSILTGGLIVAASGFKSMQLSAGGKVVAEDLGARLVMPGTTDFDERRLLNVVEEMAIASGMPVPQVYLMDDEESINAFAAGTEPSNAVIGVTRGCLQRLSRDELSGVVAHEFSHILNGDMRLNMRLMGVVFGLLVISIVGRMMLNVMRYSGGSRRGNNREGAQAAMVIMLLGLGLMIIGGIGVFFGRMIQAAVSRQREYLADASAVQFTRNPDGIAGALKKIGGMMGVGMSSAKAGEASHMFFSSAGLFSFGLATHPPLQVRIKAIQEHWDGSFVETDVKPVADGHVKRKEKKKRGAFDPLPGVAVIGALDAMGEESRRSQETGARIRSGLAEHWQEAGHDREKAQALIFGLLLAEDDELRDGEVAFLRKVAGEEATVLALDWQDEVRGVHSARKIALIDIALPALRGVSGLEYERFVEITRWLIASDQSVDLFEYMIQRVVERHLVSHFEGRGFRKMRYGKMSQLRGEANLLVSTMAEIGAGSDVEVEKAYERAVAGFCGRRGGGAGRCRWEIWMRCWTSLMWRRLW